MKTSEIKIGNMSCEGCVASARRALQSISGVRSVQVDLARGRATIEHTEDVADASLVHAITDAGYDAVQDAAAPR